MQVINPTTSWVKYFDDEIGNIKNESGSRSELKTYPIFVHRGVDEPNDDSAYITLENWDDVNINILSTIWIKKPDDNNDRRIIVDKW